MLQVDSPVIVLVARFSSAFTLFPGPFTQDEWFDGQNGCDSWHLPRLLGNESNKSRLHCSGQQGLLSKGQSESLAGGGSDKMLLQRNPCAGEGLLLKHYILCIAVLICTCIATYCICCIASCGYYILCIQ